VLDIQNGVSRTYADLSTVEACAMDPWDYLKAFFQTRYGIISGAIGILVAIYKGIPAMFKTWEFLLDRFRDQPVLEVLLYVRFPKKLPPFSPIGP